ncbi:hypothetical protein ACL02O_11025 [Micromonospora sp. MS34]|uniref:hypothetical protein n=1 Tax=Micromonospora sp. MS34 TaxID=3385971 RepID=UPI0039A385FC
MAIIVGLVRCCAAEDGRRRPRRTVPGFHSHPQADKWHDATGVSSADGTRPQIWDCAGGTNQTWRR